MSTFQVVVRHNECRQGTFIVEAASEAEAKDIDEQRMGDEYAQHQCLWAEASAEGAELLPEDPSAGKETNPEILLLERFDIIHKNRLIEKQHTANETRLWAAIDVGVLEWSGDQRRGRAHGLNIYSPGATARDYGFNTALEFLGHGVERWEEKFPNTTIQVPQGEFYESGLFDKIDPPPVLEQAVQEIGSTHDGGRPPID